VEYYKNLRCSGSQNLFWPIFTVDYQTLCLYFGKIKFCQCRIGRGHFLRMIYSTVHGFEVVLLLTCFSLVCTAYLRQWAPPAPGLTPLWRPMAVQNTAANNWPSQWQAAIIDRREPIACWALQPFQPITVKCTSQSYSSCTQCTVQSFIIINKSFIFAHL
jgi:hypothetical protein